MAAALGEAVCDVLERLREVVLDGVGRGCIVTDETNVADAVEARENDAVDVTPSVKLRDSESDIV